MENKIQSFATFSETRKAAMETKLREEAATKRTSEAQRFADLLAEFEVSTVAEIAEEQRTEFFAKLVGETDQVETEGNAFGAAVKKAKEEGEDEFTVGGETYKVKESNESVNEGKFEVDDLVYNKRTKTVGIVRMGDDKYGEVKTDADGNVSVDDLEKYNPIKNRHHQKVKVAPSTEKEINKRGLFNPFKNESVKEGRAFAAAVNRAREAGEETFEFNGKEYKVTKKTEKINEEAIKIEEAEIKSDEDFMEYAMAIYKKAFGDDFDEAKAKEAAEGMLKKSDGDYGAAIGMLQSSIG